MQNKGAISVFTILLALACIYQLSFTLVTSMVESDAETEAIRKVDSVNQVVVDSLTGAEREKAIGQFRTNYLLEIGSEEVYPLLGHTYKECKKKEINLGLDLQGGMNVTLEISVVDLIKVLSEGSTDPKFIESIKIAQENQKDAQENFVTLFGQAWDEVFPGGKLSTIFHTRENKDKFKLEATNEEILAILQEEADAVVSRTEQVLRKRIDNLGVVQPQIQRLAGTGRIIVELPGVKDQRRVRDLLQGTAKLEFWETYDNAEIIGQLQQANDILAQKQNLRSKAAKGAEAGGDDVTVDSDDTEAAIDAVPNDTNDTNSNVGNLDELLEGNSTDTGAATTSEEGLTPEEIAKKYPLYAVLNPNLQQNGGQQYAGEGPVIGSALIQDTAKVREYLNRTDVRSVFPRKIRFFWGAQPIDEKGKYVQLFAIKVTSNDGKAPLEGDAIKDAQVSADVMGNPEVTLYMNGEGSQKWKNLTKDNIGKSVAIVLDNLVYSAPTVQQEIAGGVSSISGQFTQEKAEDLANVLKAGKLPVPARIIEEAIVGPTLGAEAISDGLASFLGALLLILIYMVFYYSRAGAIADVALLANLFFVMGVLTSLGATLTLPGIAGIVLTIGMSVDANVLIYERIREELAAGKGLRLAIVDGYQNAYSSIIDANLTTLLTGIILYIFGTGPIKGFATTLIIGILTSLFSAIFITRMLFEWRLQKNAPVTFATKLTEGAFKNINFGFVGKRKIFYIISGVVIAAGIFSLATKGLNKGVDFTGGRSFLVRFEQPVAVADVAAELKKVLVTDDGLNLTPEVKTYGGSNQVKITTQYRIEDDGPEVDNEVETTLTGGLSQLGGTFEIMSSQKVGPTIADDIQKAAISSILFSLLIIFLYILFRFRKWQFGLGALVAMFHDVLIVLSIFSIFYGILPFSLEIDQAFIAAILTVVGYSINDTVVVFDRIREYLGLYKRKDYKEVVNSALNSTLSRTINTSLSTFVVLLIIFIFGGEVIQGFVFALMVGVVVGTYSSLCVATPIVVDLNKTKELKS